MQKINLLNDMPRIKLLMPASILFKMLIVFICILLSISLWQWSRIFFQYQKLHRIEKKARQIEQDYVFLVKKHPVITANKSMFNAVSKLNEILKIEKLKFDNISQQLLTSGFSKYLKLFASSVPKSISLTGFSVSNLNSNLALYGEARSAKDVSLMVEKLYLSPLFDGVNFDKYVINLDENKNKFEIATNYLINRSENLNLVFEEGKKQQ